MIEGVAVRVADPQDAEGIAGLRRTLREEQLGRPSHDDGFDARFEEWAQGEAGRRVSFLADAGGRLIGMMHLVVFERMPSPEQPATRWGYLANAFVLEGFRDCGIGSALLDRLLGHAREIGCVRVVLSPSERSVPFYARAGFSPATMLMAQVLDA
jgi:GNAT superfamily N-acetyltransferase